MKKILILVVLTFCLTFITSNVSLAADEYHLAFWGTCGDGDWGNGGSDGVVMISNPTSTTCPLACTKAGGSEDPNVWARSPFINTVYGQENPPNDESYCLPGPCCRKNPSWNGYVWLGGTDPGSTGCAAETCKGELCQDKCGVYSVAGTKDCSFVHPSLPDLECTCGSNTRACIKNSSGVPRVGCCRIDGCLGDEGSRKAWADCICKDSDNFCEQDICAGDFCTDDCGVVKEGTKDCNSENGLCGDRAGFIPTTVEKWPDDSVYCFEGSPSKSPSFPLPGEEAEWVCRISDNNKNGDHCKAEFYTCRVDIEVDNEVNEGDQTLINLTVENADICWGWRENLATGEESNFRDPNLEPWWIYTSSADNLYQGFWEWMHESYLFTVLCWEDVFGDLCPCGLDTEIVNVIPKPGPKPGPGECGNAHRKSPYEPSETMGSHYCSPPSSLILPAPPEPTPGNLSKWKCGTNHCSACKKMTCPPQSDFCVGQNIPDGCGEDTCGEGSLQCTDPSNTDTYDPKCCGGKWTEVKPN